MELSKEQQIIIDSDAEKIVVRSRAASGKTTVLTAKLVKIIDSGVDLSKVVCITFTNAAAEEMRERIGEKAKEAYIGTIHSYASYILRAHGIDIKPFIEKERFNDMLKMVYEHPEWTYEVEWLMLDEAQDCDEDQFNFIFKAVKPKRFFVVGDDFQSIYQYSGGRPDLFLQLMFEPGVTSFTMTENYRNGRKILGYAKWIINNCANQHSHDYPLRENSKPLADYEGEVIKTLPYDLREFTRLVCSTDSYNDWFILARSNDDVNMIYNYLKKYDIPVDTFKKSDITNTDLKNRLRANTVKVLTIHASKGLEANNVIVVGAMKGTGEKSHKAEWEKLEECRIAYVAATRARKKLYWIKSTTKPTKIVDFE